MGLYDDDPTYSRGGVTKGHTKATRKKKKTSTAAASQSADQAASQAAISTGTSTSDKMMNDYTAKYGNWDNPKASFAGSTAAPTEVADHISGGILMSDGSVKSRTTTDYGLGAVTAAQKIAAASTANDIALGKVTGGTGGSSGTGSSRSSSSSGSSRSSSSSGSSGSSRSSSSSGVYPVGSDISGGTKMSDGSVQYNQTYNTANGLPPSATNPLLNINGTKQNNTQPVGQQQPQTTTQEPTDVGRYVTKVDEETGYTTTYKINPDESYRYVIGEFEYDFWTLEGQKERLIEAYDTAGFSNPNDSYIAINGNYVPVVSESLVVAIDALNVALLVSGGASIAKSIANMGQAGKIALTPGGVEILAKTTPAAAGFLEEGKIITSAGASALDNSKNILTKLKYVKEVGKALGWPLVAVGGIVSFVLGKNAISKAGEVSVNQALSTYTTTLYANRQNYIDAGMKESFDEQVQCAKDVKAALDSGEFASIWSGKKEGIDEVNKCVLGLDEGLAQIDAIEAQEKQDKLLESQAAANKVIQDKADTDKAAADAKTASEQDPNNYYGLNYLGSGLSGKDYDAKEEAAAKPAADAAKLADERAYEREQKLEQRAYNEQQAAGAAQQAAFEGATATEASDGSSLTFGLLNSSGDTEFVNRDAASQAYFGKVFEELTPAQKKLLMLSKGIK